MTALTRIVSMFVLAIACFANQSETQQKRSAFEMRLASKIAGDGLVKSQVEDPPEIIYLFKQPLLSKADIAEAHVVAGYGKGTFDVQLVLTAEGRSKIEAASADHIGELLAVMIDGKVVSAVFIVGKISSPIKISRDFPKDIAQKIASELTRE